MAYKRVLCYQGIPDEFKDAKLIKLENANISKLPNLKFVTLYDVSKRLGAKLE